MQMEPQFLFFWIIILIFSIMIHEVAHGAVALALGDHTAKDLGRLTLNPLKHIDPMGSILIPGLLLLIRSPFLFGWAKPVPYNPLNLRDQRTGPRLVAGAGIGANLLLALIFGIFIRVLSVVDLETVGLPIEQVRIFFGLSGLIVITNLWLAVFNLLPIPPLDGSKLLPTSLMYAYQKTFLQYGPILTMIFMLVFLFFFLRILSTITEVLFFVITGTNSSFVFAALTAT